jgi:hypothetical protein
LTSSESIPPELVELLDEPEPSGAPPLRARSLESIPLDLAELQGEPETGPPPPPRLTSSESIPPELVEPQGEAEGAGAPPSRLASSKSPAAEPAWPGKAEAPQAPAAGWVSEASPAEQAESPGEQATATGELPGSEAPAFQSTLMRAAPAESPGAERVQAIDRATWQAAAVPLYRAAFQRCQHEENTEGAFLAAMVLEELGAADSASQLLVEKLRSVGPVRARSSLDASAWGFFRAPGFDPALADLFISVEAAAVAVKLEELRDARKLPALERAERLSETSTASIVRSLQWAARFLGTPCPHLYVVDDASGIDFLPGAEPGTALGPSVLSGRTAKDLAFLAGRHLAYHRPEHHVLLYYPTRDDLTLLLMAAVQVVLPDAGTAPPAVRALRARLARRLGDPDRTRLALAVKRLDSQGGRARIGAWMRNVELTASRVGLFLCGDLVSAAGVVRAESRSVADLSAEERWMDLVSFCGSIEHLALRNQFLTQSSESVTPPPLPRRAVGVQ